MTDPIAGSPKLSPQPTLTDLQAVLAQRVLDSIDVKRKLLQADMLNEFAAAARVVIEAARRRSTIFFIGNGGSSADAGHLAAELVGRFRLDRQPLAAMALADNTAAMTAIGNDFGYEEVFARQLSGVAHPGDVLIGLSTSGNSPNIMRAFELAPQLGVTTVAFTGASGGRLRGLADHCLRILSEDTARIQECQVLLGHTVCEIVEDAVFRSLVLT